MTPRTKTNLGETLKGLAGGITLLQGSKYANEEQKRDALLWVLYQALRWTADDVMAQAVADGFTSTQQGVF